MFQKANFSTSNLTKECDILAKHEFGIMQDAPQRGKRYDEYEPEKYVRVYNTETSFDKVKPKFLPGHWQVDGWENGLVKIRQNDNTMKVSRWMLKS